MPSGLAGSDFGRLFQPILYKNFRNQNLNPEVGSGSFTHNNGHYYRTGKLNQCIYIDSNSAKTAGDVLTFSRGTQISGSNYTNFNSNQGSISLWIKPDWENDSTNTHTIFQTATDSRIHLGILPTNSLQFRLYDSGITTPLISLTASVSFARGSWYHIVVLWSSYRTIDGTNYGVMYVNGASVSTDTSAGAAPCIPTSTFYIGTSQTGASNFLNAYLDDFAIWDRVLTDTEIAALYNSGTGLAASAYADSHLKFYAPFDGSGLISGTALACSAGNMRTGNIVTDGDMETAGVAAWTSMAAAPTTKEKVTTGQAFDTQALHVTTAAVGDSGIYQVLSWTNTASYHVEFWYKTDANSIKAKVNGVTYTLSSNGVWAKFETEVTASTTSDDEWIYFYRSSTVGDFYIDDLIIIPNLITNGGFEGTYSGGVAPGWTANGSPGAVESADENTGAKAQEGTTINSTNSNFIYQTLTVVASTWYMMSAYVKWVSGGAGYVYFQQPAGTNTISKNSSTASYTRLAGIGQGTGTSGRVLMGGNPTTDFIADDFFLFALTSVDITLTPIPIASLYEDNGLRLVNSYCTITNVLNGASVAAAKGTVVCIMKPLLNTGESSQNVFWLITTSTTSFYLRMNSSIFSVVGPSISMTDVTTQTNTTLANDFVIIFSWDFATGIARLYVNGELVATDTSVSTSETYGGTTYFGYTGTTVGQLLLKKFAFIPHYVDRNGAIGLTSHYQYAV